MLIGANTGRAAVLDIEADALLRRLAPSDPQLAGPDAPFTLRPGVGASASALQFAAIPAYTGQASGIDAWLRVGLAHDGLIHTLAVAASRGAEVQLAGFTAARPAEGIGAKADDPPPFDASRLAVFKTGVDNAFGKIEQALAARVYLEALPLVGTQLTSLFNSLDKVLTYQGAVDNALNAFESASTHDSATLQNLIKSYLPAELGNVLSASFDLASNSYGLGINYSGSQAMTVALDSKLGLPGFNFASGGSATATGTYALNFNVGESGGNFQVNGANLDLGFDVTAPNFSGQVNLGFLQFNVANLINAAHPNGSDVNGHFTLGLDNALNVTAGLTGGAYVGLHLNGQTGLAGTPHIGADLVVDWNFAGTTVGSDVTKLGSAPTIQFQHVEYDFGSFMTDFVKPIIDDLAPVMKPLQQALAVFSTDLDFLDIIPGLKAKIDITGALGGGPDGHVTLLDFAKFAIPSLNVDAISTVLNVAQEVVRWVSVLENASFGPEQYDLGSLSIVQDLRNATNFLTELQTLDLTPGQIMGTENLASFIHGLSGTGWDSAPGPGSAAGAASDTGKAIAEELILGNLFKFPIITDPTQAFGLLFGQTADLFQLKLPDINFGIGKIDANGNPTNTKDLFTIPILPGLKVDFSVAFQVTLSMLFGYDTHGMEQFAASHHIADLLNGFYVDDQRSGSGKNLVDKPEITLAAALQVALTAGLPGISISGGGNLTGQIFLDLNNALSDSQGRVHLDAMGQALSTDPFGIFDVRGRITAGLTAYVSLFGHTVWEAHPDRMTLADFSTGHLTIQPGGGTKPVVNVPLASLSGDTLTLHVGALAGSRTGISDRIDHDETLYVGQAGASAMQVAGFNHTDLYTGVVAHISAASGAGSDTLSIDESVTAAATLDGGAGNDFLYGGGGADSLQGGADRDYVEGGSGGDSINGGSGDDVLVGGAGADTMDGGGGTYDFISYQTSTQAVSINLKSGVNVGGDATGDVLSNFAGVEGSDKDGLADTLTGSDGNDLFFGLRGADSLNGGAGDDILVGGKGADILEGGGGADSASYISSSEAVTVNAGSGSGGDAEGDVLKHMEQIEGSQYDDQLTGGGSVFSLLGQYGNDTLTGGSGDDVLNGGLGADRLFGGAGMDQASYRAATAGVTLSLLTGLGTGGEATGDRFNSIERVDGSDYGDNIAGDDLGNTLYGWMGADTLGGNGGNDLIMAGDGSDVVGGGSGDDTVAGGAGGDKFDGGDGVDVATYRFSLSALTIDMGRDLSTGDAAGDAFTSIEVIEGSDLSGPGDLILGNGAANVLRGLRGDDTLKGGIGTDTFEGGLGADSIDGGGDRDQVTYARAAGGIVLNLGAALTYGGVSYLGGKASADGDGSADSVANVEDAIGSAFNDRIFAAAGGSSLSGGAGLDTLVGVSGSDTLAGGAAADSLDGGAGLQDYADYRADGAGVNVDIKAHTGRDGGGATDTLTNIEGAFGSAFNDVLSGRDSTQTDAGKDWLVGGAGADTLDGRGGADDLQGGEGDDTYKIDTLADAVRETGLSSADRVVTSVNYTVTLSDNVEQLELTGAARIGTGNALSNLMLGTTGEDTLNGLGAADDMRGGASNDVYIFDLMSDRVVEAAGGGVDEIRLSTANAPATSPVPVFSIATAWALNVENVILTDDFQAVSLTGNAQNNHLVGNSWNQTLLGAAGDDVLNPDVGRDSIDGGAGSDILELDWSSMTNGFATFAFAGKLSSGYAGSIYTSYEHSYGGAPDNRLEFANIEVFNAKLGQGDDDFTSGDGADTVSAGAGADTLRTQKGADVVDGGDGVDRWVADKSGATAAQAIVLDLTQAGVQGTYFTSGKVSSIEVLTLLTGAGADNIVTRADLLSDDVTTGLGADSVKIAGGRDLVNLGGQAAGEADTLVIDWSGMTNDVHTYAFTAVPGTGYSGSVYTAYERNYGGAPDNRVDFTGAERFDVRLGEGSDGFVSGDGDDRIFGGAGIDVLVSGAGVDTIDGGAELDGKRGSDVWQADKSGATAGMTLDLTAESSSYAIGGKIGTVTQIEALGLAAADGSWFQSGAGDDRITTTADYLSDFIKTNAGADTVKVVNGRDVVDLGDGADTLVMDWSAMTNGVATYAFDGSLAAGYAGSTFTLYEHSYGGAPDSRIDFSKVETFSVKLGIGGDDLTTGDGADTVFGGDGADILRTQKGADVVDGGVGADRWVADKSDAIAVQPIVVDLTKGGVQASYLGSGSVTGIEMLTLVTGAGADNIATRAEFYDDQVSTGGGADTVRIAGGRDTINLGGQAAGEADTLGIDWSAMTNDVHTYAFAAEPDVGYAGAVFTAYEHSYGGAPDSRVDFSGAERFDVRLGSGSDGFISGAGADRIYGGAGADVLVTGGGADTVDGGSEADATAGSDVWQADKSAATAKMTIDLTAASSTYVIGGRTGTVTRIEALGTGAGVDGSFQSGSGDDRIVTGRAALNDYIMTNGGADLAKVFAGRDRVDLGAGSDILVIDWSAMSMDVHTVGLSGTLGAGYQGSLLTGDEIHYGGASYQRVDYFGVERFSATFGAGGDSFEAGDGADTLNGGAGDDDLIGHRGADVIDGGAGADRWEADLSTATAKQAISINLQSAKASVFLTTGSVKNVEMLTLSTGAGADSIVTAVNTFTDVVDTGAGSDRVSIFGGRDTVTMGSGADTLVIDWSAGADDVHTYAFAGTLAAGYSGSVYTGYERSYGGAPTTRVDFTGVEAFNVLLGSAGDSFQSGDGADVLSGGGGADTLVAGSGADNLSGGDGDDNLDGGDLNDVLKGGAGRDTLAGGSGADTYVFAAKTDSAVGASDLIVGLELKDKIDLRGIDANGVGSDGDQAFHVVKAFDHKTGALVVSFDGTNTLIQGDIDGDGVADFVITASGDHHDFINFAL